MSNWIQIDPNADVATTLDVAFITAARKRAPAGVDPVQVAINDTVARIRAACSTGNAMDADTTRIPRSLKGLALRMIGRWVKTKIPNVQLTQDERDAGRDDNSFLLRISDDKIRFEMPDTPAGTAEMQHGDTVQAVCVPRRQTGRGRQSGL